MSNPFETLNANDYPVYESDKEPMEPKTFPDTPESKDLQRAWQFSMDDEFDNMLRDRMMEFIREEDRKALFR